MAITTIVRSSTGLPVVRQSTSFTQNGFSTDTSLNGVQFPLQNGVPYQNNYTFKVIPAALNETCVAELQSYSAAGVTLTSTSTPNIATAYTTNAPLGGTGGLTGILLDCERSILVTFSGPVVNQTSLTVSGLDYRGVEKQGIYGIAVNNTSIEFQITSSFITSISFGTDPGVQFSIGNGSCIGLPYLLPQVSYINSFWWNNETVVPVLSTTDPNNFNLELGNLWRTQANIPLTLPNAGGVTSVPRGTVRLPSAPNGTAALVLNYFTYGSDSEMNAELLNAIQSTIGIVGVKTNASGNNILPYLVEYDLIGMTYPGDLVAATAYNTLFSQ